MNYSVTANSTANTKANLEIKETTIVFGITKNTEQTLANPAELFLSAFSACILKNVERFSKIMNFQYEKAEVTVHATRTAKPAKMDKLEYTLIIYSQDKKLNLKLLKRNIEKFGTIYNTVSSSCEIIGKLEKH